MTLPLVREQLTAALRVGAALSGAVLAVALSVRIAAADDVRDLLGFTFPGVQDRLSEVAAIFANNARVLLAIAVASTVTQAANRADAKGLGRVAMEALVRLCDVSLLLSCVVQVGLIGATLGAYGMRGLGPILPHLPFELGAFSLALALYLDARRRRISGERLILVTSTAAAFLAVGAFVEVYA
jgi:hypothetical protein